MICRSCLQRASALSARTARAATAAPRTLNWSLPIRSLRPISSTSVSRQSATTATATVNVTSAPSDTPTEDAAAAGEKKQLSSCVEGTPLFGLSYFKNGQDPLALADEAYPEWLWRCLDVAKRAEEGDGEDGGDEFSKSKKQRKLAMKRQRAAEAKLLAAGDIEALAPKIPLHQQTINLPANEEGTPEGAVAARNTREELRRSMRRERKAKIKESNYLKSM
ncbi:mitochondrial ribosomal protein L37-domain-containing protein [Poronia punctata]|nr:mitochondrial ribosomal protein L37-domain-containing protein [Poronia punctata]